MRSLFIRSRHIILTMTVELLSAILIIKERRYSMTTFKKITSSQNKINLVSIQCLCLLHVDHQMEE